MSAPIWLSQMQRRLFASRLASTQQRRARKDLPGSRTVRPRLEALEDRITPTVFTPTVFTDGEGVGSLRDAVVAANADTGTATDTIQLSAGTYTLSRVNDLNNHDVSSTQGDLNITNTSHTLVIQGTTDASGNPTTILDQTVADRVFQILNLGGGSAGTVVFKDLIIEGGNAQDNGSAGALAGHSTAQGGGILDDGGDVTLSNVVVRSNQATGGAGQLAQGGGIFAQDGVLTIQNSAIQNNKATGGVGAESDGGGVYFAVTNTITPQLSILVSTVANNIAQGGAGTSGIAGNADGGNASGGGVYALSGDNPTQIEGATLSGNAAHAGLGVNGTADGLGSGGGAYIGGSTTVLNSTIAGNSVTGGDAAGGGFYFARKASGQFTNATVVGNTAELSGALGSAEGGGLDNNNGNANDVTLTNTLVAGNTIKTSAGSPQAPDVRGQLVSGGHNLIGIADGVNEPGFTAPGDLAGSLASPLNPKLGPLQNNGGPTQTLLPLSGSPALGAGDPTKATNTDQRGAPRQPGGPTDIGAVQVSAVPTSPPPSPSPSPSPVPPAPPAPPTLQVPPLLAFLNSLLGGIETVNSNGTETVTDSILGIPLLVSTFNSAGNLVSVTLFGFNITFLFG